MRVLGACSLGGAGHLNPLVPLLHAARRRGDDTLVVGPPGLREMVEHAGFEFRPGGEPPEAAVAPIRERLPVAPAKEASILGNRELFGRLATTAMLPAMEATVAAWQPELVLRDPCEYASAIVAGQRGINTAQVAISLADAEMGSIAVAAPALEAHRIGLVEELRAAPYLTRFPAALDPSPFPATSRYCVEHPATDVGALPDWWGGSDAPLVYLTFGTVLGHLSIAADVYRIALGAVAGLDARVLLTIGRHFDRTELGRIPANVRVESWVDQPDVLAAADLVVCHGGSGTAFGALESGVPLVVVPVFADQFENGRRIAEIGAGLVVEAEPSSDPGRAVVSWGDGPRLELAIRKVLGEGSFRRVAGRIAAEMAATQSIDELLDGDLHP